MMELMRRLAFVAEAPTPGSPEAEEFAALEAMEAARDAYYRNPTPDNDMAWEITQRIWEKAVAKVVERNDE